ncbi:Lovastatin nonaketide synthase [Talaromyces islandicus]|uniref:Lovastatin nonaketide synthase n=1 Tax=Talaromyces islandicus TaxID=28573 RepID=A0A0U1MAR2_TALIS|nr:Lovastatin nonaketide synthase [Talaromyces islandicus]
MAPLQNDQHEPVAIVGMGCRWPGGVSNAPQFWEFLKNRVNGWKQLQDPRFSTEGFHHPNSDRPGTFSMKGAFLAEGDARLFDHSFFGMTGLEVETMDPSQRKLLEVSYEAIENAGETWNSVSGSRTGVFVGNFCLDHWMIQSRDWDNPRPYAFTGAGTSILANRISYIFNLQGPSLTVDTACSSSMYALHLAVNAIRAGDCDSAIVASANWIADPGVQIALDKLGALSASSRCHTFDVRAEGYARGEGFAAIYLKRPSLAIADKSPIRAMIRGTSINSNGRTGGITRPSASGQETVIREAYRNAGDLPFADTTYFECHGTGTYVGDPIEVSAVGRVFAPGRSADDPMLVGSVKSNVGHGEGASALASIMKVVLSLENGGIPPVYDLQTLNPNIDFEGAKVLPVTELTPWPKDRLQRASINSFGYGGANGHCIIDHVHNVLPDYVAPGVFKISSNGATNGHENGNTDGDANGYANGHTNGHANGNTNSHANGNINGYTNGHTNGNANGISVKHRPLLESSRLTSTSTADTRQLVLLPLSSHNEQSLTLNIEALSRVVDKFSLADISYTLGVRRSRLPQRSFLIVDKDNVAQGLVADTKPVRATLQTSNIGFIFTGQGAQWHAMGAGLFEYRVFRETIKFLDHVLGSLHDTPSWSLYAILKGDCDEGLVQTAEVSQAACTAVQVGLVDLLASWSIRPSGVAGHSSGEMAAAYASGRITASEAIVAAYYRGQAVSKNQQKGAMLAVGLGPVEVEKYLEGREEQVRLAAINSPSSVTVSGDIEAINGLAATLTDNKIFNRVLKTGGNAYHSHHMVPLGRDYIEMLSNGIQRIQKLGLINETYRYQQVPWASSVTPTKSTTNLGDLATYWRANLESPVRFSEAVTNLVSMETPIHVLVEIGPHPALKGPINQVLKAEGKTVAYGSTLKRQENSQYSVLQLAGTLFSLNATVDLAAVNAVDSTDGVSLEHGCTCIDLPPYQYTYGGLNYYESRASKEYRFRSIQRHDLLGSKVVGNAKLRPQWRNILRMKDVPWLADHRLVPDAVLPGAGYMAMAVEAATRIYNEFPQPLKIKGFSLRNVSIKKSLTIPEDDYGVEVLTSMELVDTATAKSPAWATFSISSVGRETNEWSEHSTGLIKVEIEDVDIKQLEEMSASLTPRRADTRAWYKKFLSVGLGYGPAFQPLSNIRTNPEKNLAVAEVALKTTEIKGGESRYPLHPASLDGAIQLGLIACHGGRPEEANTAFVPVQLSHLYLSNEITGDACNVVARGERSGIRGAYLNFQMLGQNGDVMLNADTLRCISYSSEAKSSDKTFSSPYTRLVWRPDIRSLSSRQARQMYPPPKENVQKAPQWGVTNKLAHYVVYSMYETFGKLQDGPKPSADVGHFYDWIKRKGESDHSEIMEEARQLASQGRLLHRIDDLVSQAPDVIEVKIAKLLHDNMEDILYERRTGFDVIISEELLTPLYQYGLLMTGIYPQLAHVLDGLSHANPNMRILEIGGGTGGATRIAMKAFSGPNGIKAYKDYTFTDISAGFLGSARESLSDFRDMIFSVFDTEVDPAEQGYEQTYDLVLACQVLHATSNMHNTLSNCRKLLKPGGKLVMVETNKNFIVPGVVVGTFTGYWAGIPDGRVDAPFQSLDAWESSLRGAGFSGLDIVLDDFPSPHDTTAVIVSTYIPEEISNPPSVPVHVLYGTEPAPFLVNHIAEELKQRGIVAETGPFASAVDSVAPESRIIALFDDSHLLVNASEEDLKTLQLLSRNAASLVALTSCGTVKGRNPHGALISGLLRVLQTENPVGQYMSIDVDAENFTLEDDEARDLARRIVDQECDLHQSMPADDEDGNPNDREFSWQDGCMWVSRHVPDAGFHSQHGLDSLNMKAEMLPLNSQDAVRASFETPGVLNSLCFTSYKELLQPLPQGFIDVKVAAVGLNWKDLDNWSGRSDGNNLSSEYAGTVTAVGTGVCGLKVGDRVYGLGKGQFGNYTRVPATLTNTVRPMDDLIKMATMPVAYMTAIYAFDHIAHLKKNQTVLVQSATNDTGLALIALAKARGADVFAMVETQEQARFLVEEVAIPISHIISAPSITTLRQTSELTQKGSFDVIVSTAQGELLRSSLQVLAPLGFLIDVGRTDAQNIQSISLELLQKNATYCSVDPFAILESDPLLSEELIKSVDEYYRTGLIGPIKATLSDVAQLSQALDKISIGKLVATFTDPESVVRMIPPAPSVTFDPEASYVITGALGGLGQSLVRWMGNHGARHMVLLSRRSITSVPDAQKLVDSLSSRDIHVKSIICDVSKKDQVTRAMQQISSSRPIKGIVHAAVSYLDLTFDKLSASRWNEGLSAKVEGTKNLHEATLAMPLDFFVMTTSALSVYAFATQGAYTAANNFQDAFARYRQGLGLPASTVSFSLIHDITQVGTDSITMDLFERNKTLTLSESQFLTLFEPAFLNNKTSTANTSPGQWFGQLADPLSAANLHTYLDPAGMMLKKREDMESETASSAVSPRWYSDGRISLIMRAFLDTQRQSASLQGSAEEGSKNTVAALRRRFNEAVQVGASERANTVAFVQTTIINAVAEMLFVDSEGIDPIKSVAELGVDSLIAAELRNWFLQALGKNITMLDLLDPSVPISTLAENITDEALAAKS